MGSASGKTIAFSIPTIAGRQIALALLLHAQLTPRAIDVYESKPHRQRQDFPRWQHLRRIFGRSLPDAPPHRLVVSRLAVRHLTAWSTLRIPTVQGRSAHVR